MPQDEPAVGTGPTRPPPSTDPQTHFSAGALPTPALSGEPRVLGEYELLARLGAGGMGVVYKARHRRLGKLVALKLLPAGPRRSAEAVARFLREMRAVGQLDHPNLVEASDAGEQDGTVYLAMNRMEGSDLQ